MLIFNICVYFLTNLSRTGGGFWTFHLFNYLAYITMQGFFRTFGLLCSNFDSAFRLASFFIPNMVQYAGYMIPVFEMKRWLFWIFYINPVSYGEYFSATKLVLCPLTYSIFQHTLVSWRMSLCGYQ